MTTTLIRGGAGAGEWQERLFVVELPHGTSTIAAKVWRWPFKSEERDNRTTFGLIHQRSGGDDHTFALGADLSRCRYRSSGMERRTWTAFSASVKRAKNTPADSTVYPLVYPLQTHDRRNPLNAGTLPPGSNGAWAPSIETRKPQAVRSGAFLWAHKKTA